MQFRTRSYALTALLVATLFGCDALDTLSDGPIDATAAENTAAPEQGVTESLPTATEAEMELHELLGDLDDDCFNGVAKCVAEDGVDCYENLVLCEQGAQMKTTTHALSTEPKPEGGNNNVKGDAKKGDSKGKKGDTKGKKGDDKGSKGKKGNDKGSKSKMGKKGDDKGSKGKKGDAKKGKKPAGPLAVCKKSLQKCFVSTGGAKKCVIGLAKCVISAAKKAKAGAKKDAKKGDHKGPKGKKGAKKGAKKGDSKKGAKKGDSKKDKPNFGKYA